jgi:alpha-L-fucosidase 2
MMKIIYSLSVVFIIVLSGNAQSQLSNQEYVARYKAVFSEPPKRVPHQRTPDSPVAGNGDIGIVIGGTPDSQRIYISKNDFWKAKEGYPEGGVCLPGGMDIRIPDLKGASYHAEQLLADGTIKQKFVKEGLTFHLSAFVPDKSNCIIFELFTEGNKECRVNLNLWSKTGFASKNSSGREENVYWVSRSFDSTDLDWETHITMAMKTIGAQGNSFTLKPKGKVYIVVAAFTNHDTPNFREAALLFARESTVATMETLRKSNHEWWKNFWAESLVRIGDPVMEQYYYGSQYLLASCSRGDNFAPGLWGNALTGDATFDAWQGDYHTNYNYMSPWWGSYSSNHIEITEPYDQPILDFMAKAKGYAKKYLQCDGVYYPVGIGPMGFNSTFYPLTAEKMQKAYGITDTHIEGGIMFCGQRSNALFCTTNMLMRFYSTYDKRYANKVYPFLTEVANFWEDYLKFVNDRYISYNDNFWEVGPWSGKDWRTDMATGDINPTQTLGMIRMLYRGLIGMSNFLQLDQDRHAKWNHILTHLSPIPTEIRNGKTRIKVCEGGTSSGSRTLSGFGRVSAHGLVFPAGVAGEYTDPEFASIIRGDIDFWGKEKRSPMDADWNELLGGFETYFTSAIRVGYDPEIVYNELNIRIKKESQPNLFITQGGCGVEALSGIPSCINEMLLQSYEGVIRVFPNWLPGKDASFKTLRAYGAFLVSSEKKDNNILFVEIISEKGRDCALLNPWQQGTVRIIADGDETIPFEEKDNRIIFKTAAGKKYLIKQV